MKNFIAIIVLSMLLGAAPTTQPTTQPIDVFNHPLALTDPTIDITQVMVHGVRLGDKILCHHALPMTAPPHEPTYNGQQITTPYGINYNVNKDDLVIRIDIHNTSCLAQFHINNARRVEAVFGNAESIQVAPYDRTATQYDPRGTAPNNLVNRQRITFTFPNMEIAWDVDAAATIAAGGYATNHRKPNLTVFHLDEISLSRNTEVKP